MPNGTTRGYTVKGKDKKSVVKAEKKKKTGKLLNIYLCRPYRY